MAAKRINATYTTDRISEVFSMCWLMAAERMEAGSVTFTIKLENRAFATASMAPALLAM